MIPCAIFLKKDLFIVLVLACRCSRIIFALVESNQHHVLRASLGAHIVAVRCHNVFHYKYSLTLSASAVVFIATKNMWPKFSGPSGSLPL